MKFYDKFGTVVHFISQLTENTPHRYTTGIFIRTINKLITFIRRQIVQISQKKSFYLS